MNGIAESHYNERLNIVIIFFHCWWRVNNMLGSAEKSKNWAINAAEQKAYVQSQKP